MACPRADTTNAQHVGYTCTCGQHLKECEACGRTYPFWNNPHYQSAVGWDTPEGGAIGESIYICTKEKASAVHGRRQAR